MGTPSICVTGYTGARRAMTASSVSAEVPPSMGAQLRPSQAVLPEGSQPAELAAERAQDPKHRGDSKAENVPTCATTQEHMPLFAGTYHKVPSWGVGGLFWFGFFYSQ